MSVCRRLFWSRAHCAVSVFFSFAMENTLNLQKRSESACIVRACSTHKNYVCSIQFSACKNFPGMQLPKRLPMYRILNYFSTVASPSLSDIGMILVTFYEHKLVYGDASLLITARLVSLIQRSSPLSVVSIYCND